MHILKSITREGATATILQCRYIDNHLCHVSKSLVCVLPNWGDVRWSVIPNANKQRVSNLSRMFTAIELQIILWRLCSVTDAGRSMSVEPMPINLNLSLKQHLT